MAIDVVSTWPDGDLLPALRSLLVDADEALLCVAFVNRKGVSLIDAELNEVAKRGRCRLLLTSVFGGGESGFTAPAVHHLQNLQVDLRVLNWKGGTYHPKMYLGRSGDQIHALIGSANLTSGLLTNAETAVRLHGNQEWPPLAKSWGIAEQLWNHPAARDWESDQPAAAEGMSSELELLLRSHLPSEVTTLGRGAVNRVDRVTNTGVYVETRRSAGHPELVDAWMLDLAWEELQRTGVLTNSWLLNEARVFRSSFVCAALTHLPGVEVVSTRPIELRLSLRPGR